MSSNVKKIHILKSFVDERRRRSRLRKQKKGRSKRIDDIKSIEYFK